MDLTRYVAVLMVLCLEGGESGGHGGKHHDHVKLHVPEFIHHDHHTKVVTIHHHHHKPKKEQHHHHHHHHHPKPHIPHGHHYHHHKNSHSIKTTVTKKGGHGHHKHHAHAHPGHHGHHSHHDHHGHQGHHGHHGHHGHGHHHDAPTYSYDPPAVPTFEEDFGSSYKPSEPSYGGGFVHQSPQVHGISHTVKQVKVYDSLPGVIPTNTRSHGYEVTEEGEDIDNDVFTSGAGIQQAYPDTFGYLRGAAAQPVAQNAFTTLNPQSTALSNTHDPFASAETSPTSFAGQGFGASQHDPFALTDENIGLPNVQPSADFPVIFQGASGIEQPNSFVGIEGDGGSFGAEHDVSDDTPVSFAREAGIQQSSNTGGVETVVY